ncbi:MAG: PAS domain S-box protein, partial [Moraxellaceae bacterium]
MESGGAKLSDVNPAFRQQMDSLLEGIQIVDRNWEYLFVNEVFARQVDMLRENLIGQELMRVFPGLDTLPVFERMRDCFENRIVQRFETYFEFPDGRGKWFDARIEPIPEGICIYTLDITQFKETLSYNTKIKNLYSLLRQINQSIVYLKSERELFLKACFI